MAAKAETRARARTSRGGVTNSEDTEPPLIVHRLAADLPADLPADLQLLE